MVMTTEILRNMLYESVGSAVGKGWLLDVDAIVLDEVHYLSDISRGTVWEETVLLKSRRFMVRSQASCRSLCPQLFLKVEVLNGDFDENCGIWSGSSIVCNIGGACV